MVNAEGERALASPLHDQRLFSEATNVRHVAGRLRADDSTRLSQLLRQPRKVEGYLYQCRIAAHYIRGGGELRYFSVGGEIEGDLVVGATGGNVEIQCKVLEAGTGRRIRPAEFAELWARIANELDTRGHRCVIHVRCQGRLERQDIPALAANIKVLIEGKGSAVVLDRYDLAIEARSELITIEELSTLRERAHDQQLRPPHVAFLGQDGVLGVQAVLRVTSQQNDYVVGRMLRSANQAAKQVTSGLPGIVFVHVPEVVDWALVKSTPGFERHVSHGFLYFGATNIAALVFTSEPIGAFVFPNRRASKQVPAGFKVTGPFVAS